MRSRGLGNCSRQLLKEVATVRSMDVVLPVKEAESDQTREVRLRAVGRRDQGVAQLLCQLGLELPSAPRMGESVVERYGGNDQKAQ